MACLDDRQILFGFQVDTCRKDLNFLNFYTGVKGVRKTKPKLFWWSLLEYSSELLTDLGERIRMLLLIPAR